MKTMKIQQALLLLVLGAVGLLCLAGPASAYDWGDTCLGDKRTWDSSNITFRPSTVSFPIGTGWRTSVEAMRSAWNTHSPATNFRFTYSYSSSSTYSTGDGTNSILITSDYSWGPNTLGVTRTLYKACFWPFWHGKIEEVDILFNPAWTWDTSTNPNPTDWRVNLTLVGIHEYGHGLGLKHEDDILATMNSYYPNGGVIGNSNDVHPHADDVHGNRAGYGTSGTVRDFAASAYRRTAAGESDPIVPPGTTYRLTSTPFRFTIENRGTVNETSVGLKFYLSTDRTITTSDYLVGSAGYALNAGFVGTYTAYISVPTSVPAGYYYFGYILDPENYISESNEGNNAVGHVTRTYVSPYRPPNACFTVNPSWGNAPLTVTVNASCSSDPDGTITSYSWDMGDGATRSGQSFSYTYWGTGFYDITLTVTDNHGLTDTAWDWVEVMCEGGEICPE
jgi:hypothetical protein